MTENEHILVAVDGSEASERAVKFAARMALDLGAELDLVAIVDLQQLKGHEGFTMSDEQVMDWQRAVKHRLLRRAAEAMGDAPHTLRVLDGNAANVLHAEVCKRQPRMVVLGRTGKGSVEAWFMGSVSRYLSSRSPVPVCIVG